MMTQIVKKQWLLLFRNKQELIILLGMPLILISILGFSLGSFMNGETPDIKAKVALIEHGNEQKEIEQFINEIKNMNLPEKQKQAMIAGAKQIQPSHSLKNDVFGHKELKDHIELVIAKPSHFDKIKKDDHYDAVIEIPEKFTYNTLQTVFFNKKESRSTITLFRNEGNELASSIIEEILESFQNQFSTLTVLGAAGLLHEIHFSQEKTFEGTIESVTKREPINATVYYTIGMSVMFVLYIASSIGTYAFQEKQLHVFNRILLANISKWTYFSSIFISGMTLAFIQLMILYGVTALVYDVRWPNIPAFFTVCFMLSFAVGGMTVLLTSLTYNLNSELITNFFSSVIVTFFAFLGGSFFPSGELSNVIQFLGELTPNGAGMTAFLKLQQGYDLSDITGSLIFLTLFGLLMIVIAVISFPKRGETI
ncbi:ABC transporter permease [Bacillus aquiflavi]|uniref:ABC transporter permease n=1 Tax=Bacillus aquiflavi TaxID=2672567 RepID=UPI001CA97FFF|nr:ABC transporter permease [Bacillus aquiflavi]UAC49612.1 ABC transporter permease [Bacillus aquiflavi]